MRERIVDASRRNEWNRVRRIADGVAGRNSSVALQQRSRPLSALGAMLRLRGKSRGRTDSSACRTLAARLSLSYGSELDGWGRACQTTRDGRGSDAYGLLPRVVWGP